MLCMCDGGQLWLASTPSVLLSKEKGNVSWGYSTENLSVTTIIFFRVHLASSKWSPKRRVAYIHVGEPSELGSL
jgi:hypothetical protein